MIIVVSDASPIINLAAVSRLSLLQELFGSILAPPSVWAEVMAGVLTESKARGLIVEVKPLLNLMVRRAGFRITDSLYRQVLQSVGEA